MKINSVRDRETNIIFFQDLLKTFKDFLRLFKTFQDLSRLFKTFETFSRLSMSLQDC